MNYDELHEENRSFGAGRPRAVALPCRAGRRLGDPGRDPAWDHPVGGEPWLAKTSPRRRRSAVREVRPRHRRDHARPGACRAGARADRRDADICRQRQLRSGHSAAVADHRRQRFSARPAAAGLLPSRRGVGARLEPSRDPVAITLAGDAAREPLRPLDHALAALGHRYRAEAAAEGPLRLLLRCERTPPAGHARRLSGSPAHHRGLHRQRAARFRSQAGGARHPPGHRHRRAELQRGAGIPEGFKHAGEHAEQACKPPDARFRKRAHSTRGKSPRHRGAADVHGLAPPLSEGPRASMAARAAGGDGGRGWERCAAWSSRARATGHEKARARRAFRLVAFGLLPLTPP